MLINSLLFNERGFFNQKVNDTVNDDLKAILSQKIKSVILTPHLILTTKFYPRR